LVCGIEEVIAITSACDVMAGESALPKMRWPFLYFTSKAESKTTSLSGIFVGT
jgi:hypothetical protein